MANRSGHRIKGFWEATKRWWKGGFKEFLEPLAKVAQIVAVGIAGFWTYHIYQITGEGEVNPEVWVSAQTFSYSKDARILLVRIRQKNVGKVPVSLDSDALSLTVKKISEGLKVGSVNMDTQAPLFEVNAFKSYEDGVELSPGAEYEDIAEFVVEPGLYHMEASLALPDDDVVNNVAVLRVE
jgi:hypothetical protein